MSTVKVTTIVEVDGVVVTEVEVPPVVPPEIIKPELLDVRAVAHPDKPHVNLWNIKGWNNAHLKEPPQERGAELIHPNMDNRIQVPDGANMLLNSKSIKVDGGGRAHEVVRYGTTTVDPGSYIKESEVAL